MIEQLTEEQREWMSERMATASLDDIWCKALRIIDEQAKQLAVANALLIKVLKRLDEHADYFTCRDIEEHLASQEPK